MILRKKKIGIAIAVLFIMMTIHPVVGSFNSMTFKENKNRQFIKYNRDFIPGEFLIKFKKDVKIFPCVKNNIMITGIQSIDELNKEFKVRDIQYTILSVNKKPKNPELFSSIGLDRIYTFTCDKPIDVIRAVQSYIKNPFVEFVEPNKIGYGCLIPNDVSFKNQWGLHNTGQSGGTPDCDIDGPEAWNIKLGSYNVIIAIVDTGIDYNHQDLDAHIWQNTEEIPNNGTDDDGNGYIDDTQGWDFRNNDNDPKDDHNHGTHCAGIAGAETNNNLGIAGVMWMCKLMAVKSGSLSNTFNENNAANGIIYAADNGADIISMSWSFNWNPLVIENACSYAKGVGCFLVAAMGNHGNDADRWPALYNSVMAVGATDDDDKRCSWSAFGDHINIVAPGLHIYSTIRNNKYEYFWGTSMSTPQVAGLAGLLKAQDPSRSNSDIWTIIINTADDLGTSGWDKYYGMGGINAYTALYGAPYKPILDGLSNGKTGDEYTYTGLTWDPNGDKIYYWFDWGDGTSSGWIGAFNSGQTGSANHIRNSRGTYYIKVKAKDVGGKESNWSDPLKVTMPKSKSFYNIMLNLYFEKNYVCENLLNLNSQLYCIVEPIRYPMIR
jgi:subtilisin family serine protease